MRTIPLLLFFLVCSFLNARAQKNLHVLDIKNTYRIKLQFALAFSNVSGELKDHLSASGLGDKINRKADWLSSGGNDFFPQATPNPMNLGIGIDKRIGKMAWLGILFGTDSEIEVKGYDRFGTASGFFSGTYSIGQMATVEHYVWYISPQLTVGLPKNNAEKIEWYAGPVFSFNRVEWAWEGASRKYINEKTIGVTAGVNIHLVRKLFLSVGYRYNGTFELPASSNSFEENGEVYHSSIGKKRIMDQRIQIGLTYQGSFKIG